MKIRLQELKETKAWRVLTARHSFGALFDRIPWLGVSVIAFIALADFGLWPLMVLAPTLQHLSFDRMVDWNRDLLDKALFPMVAWMSVAAYLLALVKALREKRPLLRSARRNPALLIFAALLVWETVNMFFTNGLTYSVMHGAGLKHESFPLHLEYFLGFFALGLFLRNRALKLWLLRGMAIVGVILGATSFYLFHHLTATSWYYDWKPVVASIFTNINYYGYYLTVFIGLSAAMMVVEERRGWRLFHAAALVLNAVVLGYNDTVGAQIGSLFACLFVIVARRVIDGKFSRRAFAPLILFAAALCLTGALNGRLSYNTTRLSGDVSAILTQPDSGRANIAGSGRWYIWKCCMELIAKNPLFGIGYEGINVRNLAYIGNQRPHNEIMQYTLFYGIPGGLLYFCGCLGVYLRALRRRARLDALTFAALTAAFGYLVGSNFGLTVYNTAPYFFIMLGLGYMQGGVGNAQAAAPDASGGSKNA